MPRPPNPDLIRTIKNIVATEVQKKGVDGLSLRHIAKCAGITPSTIYYYFENKEDLLNAIKLSVVQLTTGRSPAKTSGRSDPGVY
jgi:TetR/AcrR family transcriptional repressor of multidrug resistance operon